MRVGVNIAESRRAIDSLSRFVSMRVGVNNVLIIDVDNKYVALRKYARGCKRL